MKTGDEKKSAAVLDRAGAQPGKNSDALLPGRVLGSNGKPLPRRYSGNYNLDPLHVAGIVHAARAED